MAFNDSRAIGMYPRIGVIFLATLTLLLSACGMRGKTDSSAVVSNPIVVSPPAPYSVGGTISGLAGSGLILQNNSGDNLAVSANGSFSFATTMNSNDTYLVTVLAHPTALLQNCTVTNGTGTVAVAHVTSVQVACVILGDINDDGLVSHIDVLLAQRIALGMITATSGQVTRGDIHPDGKIDASDYLLIQKMVLGL